MRAANHDHRLNISTHISRNFITDPTIIHSYNELIPSIR